MQANVAKQCIPVMSLYNLLHSRIIIVLVNNINIIGRAAVAELSMRSAISSEVRGSNLGRTDHD